MLNLQKCIKMAINGNPLQYSCLESPMDGGAWWATVHAFLRSRTRPKRLSAHTGRGPVVSVCGTLTFVASPDPLDSLISPSLRVEVDLHP